LESNNLLAGWSGFELRSTPVQEDHCRKVIASGKATRPEDRLVPFITVPSALSIPAGLFVCGWSTDRHVHWIVPEIGTAVVGFGISGVISIEY